MKQFIITLFSILVISCITKNEKEEETNALSLNVVEVSALDSDGLEVRFNIGYSIIHDTEIFENCNVENEEGLNDLLVKPVIRSIIRSEVSKLNKAEIDKIEKEKFKAQINEQLDSGDITLNGKNLTDCTVSIGLFSMTKRK